MLYLLRCTQSENDYTQSSKAIAITIRTMNERLINLFFIHYDASQSQPKKGDTETSLPVPYWPFRHYGYASGFITYVITLGSGRDTRQGRVRTI